jgi:hypothetical protein
MERSISVKLCAHQSCPCYAWLLASSRTKGCNQYSPISTPELSPRFNHDTEYCSYNHVFTPLTSKGRATISSGGPRQELVWICYSLPIPIFRDRPSLTSIPPTGVCGDWPLSETSAEVILDTFLLGEDDTESSVQF